MLIAGNRIGTTRDGIGVMSNAYGILVQDTGSALIGGTVFGSGNLIAKNAVGIGIVGSGAAVVQGNTIGPDALGQGGGCCPQGIGIQVYYNQGSVIGGVGAAANVIAFNNSGIILDAGTSRATLTRNSMFSNGFGVKLFDGQYFEVTPNDPCDADSGPNGLQNFPVLSQSTQIGGQVRIDGTLNSVPNAPYVLEFFVSPTCHASGNGEGKTYLGAMTATTDDTCNATFSGLFVGSLAPGSVVTATATDTLGNTSEFSACVPVTAGPTPAFYTITPCRVLDTRDPVGPYGGPALNAAQERDFQLAGQCGIPATATAVSLNVAVTQPDTGPGFLTLRPGGSDLPLAATINYKAGQTRANNATMALGGPGTVTVYCGQPSGTAHVIIDVNGYFQ